MCWLSALWVERITSETLNLIKKAAKEVLCCVNRVLTIFVCWPHSCFSKWTKKHIDIKKMLWKALKPQERFLIQKPKQGSSVETVIRNKCLFLFAMLGALLLLVTWSPSSTLMMKGQPLKSVTVRASKQRGETDARELRSAASFMKWCYG